MSLFLNKINRNLFSIIFSISILLVNNCKGQVDSIVNFKLVLLEKQNQKDSLKPLFPVKVDNVSNDTSVIKTHPEDSLLTKKVMVQMEDLANGKDYFESKTFLFGLSNYFFPVFRGPGFLYSTNDKWFSPGVNFVHCFNTEIKLQQRISFCSSLQIMHTGIAYRKPQLVEYGNGRSYPYPNSTRYNGNESHPIQFASFNISFGVKVFRKNNSWPIGKYSKFEFLIFIERVSYKKDKFVNYAEQQVTEGDGVYYYKNFAIAYTLGTQRILYKKYVLDYGIRVGFTPMVIPNYYYNTLLVSNMEMRLRVDSNYRLFREQLLNFHLGLSFLSF